MKNLILFALVVFAAWYGWTHYQEFKGKDQNEVVVTNQSSRDLTRVRVVIGERVEVIDTLKAGSSERRTFPTPPSDATFSLTWNYAGLDAEPHWSGGEITAGPLLMRHTLLIQDGGDVIWSSEKKPEKEKGKGFPLP